MTPSNSSPGEFHALLSGSHFSFVDEVTKLFRELYDFSVPEGYEDESGFHFASSASARLAGNERQDWQGEYI